MDVKVLCELQSTGHMWAMDFFFFLIHKMGDCGSLLSGERRGALHSYVNYLLESCPFKVMTNNTNRAWVVASGGEGWYLCFIPKLAFRKEPWGSSKCWAGVEIVTLPVFLHLFPSSCPLGMPSPQAESYRNLQPVLFGFLGRTNAEGDLLHQMLTETRGLGVQNFC
jgi:hypothetical protein